MIRLPAEYVGRLVSRGSAEVDVLIRTTMEFLDSVAEKTGIKEHLAFIRLDLRNATRYETKLGILNEEIFPLMNSIAPEGCYFGLGKWGRWRYGFRMMKPPC